MEITMSNEYNVIDNETVDKRATLNSIHYNYEIIDHKIEAVNAGIRELTGEFNKLRGKTAESATIVGQTDSIIKYIQNVATQMTLLGFNASIEAKHVGEAGAGFNVIAQEVRELAEQTQSQTLNVEDVLSRVRSSIANIENEIANAVEILQANIATVKELSEIINVTSDEIKKL